MYLFSISDCLYECRNNYVHQCPGSRGLRSHCEAKRRDPEGVERVREIEVYWSECALQGLMRLSLLGIILDTR